MELTIFIIAVLSIVVCFLGAIAAEQLQEMFYITKE